MASLKICLYEQTGKHKNNKEDHVNLPYNAFHIIRLGRQCRITSQTVVSLNEKHTHTYRIVVKHITPLDVATNVRN